MLNVFKAVSACSSDLYSVLRVHMIFFRPVESNNAIKKIDIFLVKTPTVIFLIHFDFLVKTDTVRTLKERRRYVRRSMMRERSIALTQPRTF